MLKSGEKFRKRRNVKGRKIDLRKEKGRGLEEAAVKTEVKKLKATKLLNA